MPMPPLAKLEVLAGLDLNDEELAIATRLAFLATQAGYSGARRCLPLSQAEQVHVTRVVRRDAIARRLDVAADRLGLRLQSSAVA